jgi:aminoglycoside phosphotransferase (APT) family kinase protein
MHRSRWSKTMSESYEKHLAQIHAEQTISAELLNDILHTVSSAPVLSKQRIIAGEVNEVYEVTFADGLAVIVRIARDEAKNVAHFQQEQWAIRECGARGVPVPEILGIWRLSTEGQSHDICVQRKIKGVLLRDANLPQSALRQIVAQAGALLSRIHAIPVKGLGYINGSGEGEFLTPESEISAFVAMEAEFHALAKRLDLSDRAMRRAFRLVVDDGRAAQSMAPCLTHNDFSTKHILVANAAISGIIDFGEAAGGEPLSDLVRWDYYDAARFPFEWLREGYADKHVFGADFTRRLCIKRIAFGLWAMRWYDRSGYTEGVADARAKLVSDLMKME